MAANVKFTKICYSSEVKSENDVGTCVCVNFR